MEGRAMRFLNLCGNKFFSLAFSYLIGQHVKDTLCGTKVLLKSDYDRLMAGRGYFGEFDPFGDFDLLFGAAKLGLKIVDLPIATLRRQFQLSTGHTLHQFIIERRLQYACKLLMKPDLAIPDIALAAGFSSQQHMTMAFRNRLGTTPKSYHRANSDA